MGSEELINGKVRYCIWVKDGQSDAASKVPAFAERFELVRNSRLESPLQSTIEFAEYPYRFVYLAGESNGMTIAIGAVSSENRPYLPVDCLPSTTVCSNRLYAIYDGTLVDFAVLESSMHLAWAFAVCGRLEQRLSYSNTLGWNTFPLPTLTHEHQTALTRCAEEILLAREAHFPATIAEMYDPEAMDTNYPELRAAHDRNDEILERIYIGRRFRNDTERLEKLFEMYSAATGGSGGGDRSTPGPPRTRGKTSRSRSGET